MAKTPSHNVVAAMWILNQLDSKAQSEALEPTALTTLADSRVNEAKAEKVYAQIDKIVNKTRERCKKIVDKFNVPVGVSSSKKVPPKKSRVIESDEEE